VARRPVSEVFPALYGAALQKERIKRHIRNFFSKERLARFHTDRVFDNVVKSHTSIIVRRLHGVDIALQENKLTNISLACDKINGIVVLPGETFSFWYTVGKPTARKGYKEGLVISRSGITSGVGGGLCQMGNMIHWLVLNSPMEVTELHHHSDALFPDERRRVPFGTGTSVAYNAVDYRFKNVTDQPVQILCWVEKGELCGELRSERPFPYKYKLTEENHHFKKEGEKYYRISQVYRTVSDRETGDEIRRELVLDNHSEVMYDHSLIPPEQIRNEDA